MARQQVTYVICDRCGDRDDKIGLELHTASVPGKWNNHVDMGPAGGYDVIDLCTECREEFLFWLGLNEGVNAKVLETLDVVE